MSDIRDRALQLTYWLSIAFCICTVIWTQIVPLAQALSDGQLVYGEYGTNDFIEYWSAWHAYAAGLNPYDPYVMQATQRLVDPSIDVPLMMWNPPWILTLFSPILSLSFSTAAILWLIVNFLIYLIAVRLYSNDKDALLLSLLFAPFWHSMFVGQLGSFLALGAALVFRGMTASNSFYLAVGLFLLSLKPHFCIPIAMLVVWRIVLIRRKTILLRLFAFFLFFFSYFLSQFPETIMLWLDVINSTEDMLIVPHPRAWVGSSLIGFLRISSSNLNNLLQNLVTILPVLTGAIFLAIFTINRFKYNLSNHGYILSYTLLMSPLAWIFDYTILTCIVVFISKNRIVSPLSITLVTIQILQLLVLNLSKLEHSSILPFQILQLLVFFLMSNETVYIFNNEQSDGKYEH